MQFWFRDYRPLFPDRITAEEHFCALLGRELTPRERQYLMLAEIALGALPRDVTAERRPNLTPLVQKANVIPALLKKANVA